MKNINQVIEVEKGKIHIVVELIEYIPNAVISNFAVPNFGKIELPLLDIKKSPHFCIW